jgi:hypothetical protein
MSTALEMGIAIAKANVFGDPHRKAEAIEYFKQALLENPREIQAWSGIVAMTDNDNSTKKYCLRKILEIDPQNEGAKIKLDFILNTEPNFKWLKEEVSPIQIFFESQQKAQPPFRSGQPYHSNQPPRPNQPYRPTAPNFGNAATPLQTSRPVYAQVKPKKKGVSPWLSSFLVFSVLIGIVSIIVGLASSFLVPLVSEMDPSISPESYTAMPPFYLSIGFFMWLEILLAEAYWMISGYAGVYKIIKKGYLVEYLGCSLVLAGIPLVLPLFLGAFLYNWADRLKEKRN